MLVQKPTTRVDLDTDEGRIEAGERAAVDDGERHDHLMRSIRFG